jgi:hypothetical protein
LQATFLIAYVNVHMHLFARSMVLVYVKKISLGIF